MGGLGRMMLRSMLDYMLSWLNSRRLQGVAVFAVLLFKASRDMNRLSHFLSTYSQDLYLSTPNEI